MERQFTGDGKQASENVSNMIGPYGNLKHYPSIRMAKIKSSDNTK